MICSAKDELKKLKPTDPEEKATLNRAEVKLDEGTVGTKIKLTFSYL